MNRAFEPAAGASDERLDAVLDFPHELLEYLAWLRQQPPGAADDYLFEKPAVRFEAAPEDVILAEPDLRVQARADQTFLLSPRAPGPFALAGVPADKARALLGLCNGERCLAEIRTLAGDDAPFVELLLQQTFGKLLFAPLALLELERAISGSEIARFPGSPYEIARPYWRNMAAVRSDLSRLEQSLEDTSRANSALFVRELRRLHVLALLGSDLQTFYKPRSRIGERKALPGRLMHSAPRVVDSPNGALFLEGPRVNAHFVGGEAYRSLLYASLQLPAAGTPPAFIDEQGLGWGRIVHARAPADAAAGDWFCPPRPLLAEHFAALGAALRDAIALTRARDEQRALGALASFHQRFVRLHPFYCANQCLAMNVVNGRLQALLGAGIPHLMLDHLALVLPPAAYALAFRRCVSAYLYSSPDIAARYRALASKRARASSLLQQISAVENASRIASAIAGDVETARLLLLV